MQGSLPEVECLPHIPGRFCQSEDEGRHEHQEGQHADEGATQVHQAGRKQPNHQT